MKKFMVIATSEGEQFATFTDDYAEASRTRMDYVCGLGAYAEIYIREKQYDEDGNPLGLEYVFLEA